MEGGTEVCREAGVALAGGHSMSATDSGYRREPQRLRR